MFQILDEACTPKKGTKFSACVDLFAREDVVIGAGETVLVPLGVKIDSEGLDDAIHSHCIGDKMCGLLQERKDEFLKSHQLNLHIRSSMSAKYGLVIANGTGIIDLDYPGEIMICLHNPVKSITKDNELLCHCDHELSSGFNWNYQIKKGQPIAQTSLVEHKTHLLGVKSEDMRDGGFGSTDA